MRRQSRYRPRLASTPLASAASNRLVIDWQRRNTLSRIANVGGEDRRDDPEGVAGGIPAVPPGLGEGRAVAMTAALASSLSEHAAQNARSSNSSVSSRALLINATAFSQVASYSEVVIIGAHRREQNAVQGSPREILDGPARA
jgi:hypothetical protein